MVFERLRHEILETSLEPGSKLRIDTLVQRYGVSQTAVREALSRLVAEGLVIALDNRGFRVSSISSEDLHDTTQTRIELDALAIRRSFVRGDAAWEGRVLAAYHQLSKATPATPGEAPADVQSWDQLHRRFHDELGSACGLTWLMRFRTLLTDQSERYRKIAMKIAIGAPPLTHRNVEPEHREMLESALARDADRCIAVLTKHFNDTADMVIRRSEARS